MSDKGDKAVLDCGGVSRALEHSFKADQITGARVVFDLLQWRSAECTIVDFTK